MTILHPDPGRVQEGEQLVSSCCAEICQTPQHTSKSCSKIVLVHIFPEGEPSRKRKVDCMIDDQSNRYLATSTFFDAFSVSNPETEYVLSTCSGRSVTSGRRASGFVVCSLKEHIP